MLKYSLIFLLFISFLKGDVNSSLDFKDLKVMFKNGVRDFSIGSYYNALDEFSYIAKFPQSPYYLNALKMLAKTYLAIGKRTGEKKYLWQAESFLNTYLGRGGKRDWEYYYIKGEIYELLGFYERALSNYKIALQYARTKREKLNVVIGILRTSVWLKKLDLATKYIVILNIETLSKKQKEEFEFLKGMFYFMRGEYNKAIDFFQNSFKYNENFLIDNPNYYYYVAETAYRIGDIDFAKKLFKRIVMYIKNKEVLQKSLLRLGDIAFLEGDYKESASYYYRLVKRFPDTTYATIAKLKILFLIKKDRALKYYIKKFLPNSPFLQEPDKFIIKTLVKNRNNYIGLFALANFGMEVFELNSPSLFKRLSWELSFISVDKLKYEHIEYFKRAWSSYLLQLQNPSFVCEIYFSNQKFFFKVFGKDVLEKIAKDIKKCKGSKEYIKFLDKMAKKFKEDKFYFEMIDELIKLKEYKKAKEVLKEINKKECIYFKYQARLCYLLDENCKKEIESFFRSCKKRDFYKKLFEQIALKENSKDFILENIDSFSLLYKKDPVVKKFIKESVDKFLLKEKYKDIIDILTPLESYIGKDCYLSSVLALSYLRSGKIVYAKEILSKLKSCKDNIWYEISVNALKDKELQERVLNVGED